jgi:hypothetical protein
MATQTFWVFPCISFNFCTFYAHSQGPPHYAHWYSNTPTQTQTSSFAHTHIKCTYIYTDSTQTHTKLSYTLLLLCLSYILMPRRPTPRLYISTFLTPVSLHIVNIVLEPTDPIHSMINYFLIFFFNLILISYVFLFHLVLYWYWLLHCRV